MNGMDENGRNGSKPDQRLIPNKVVALAHSSPDRVFASIPLTAKVVDGFYHITYLEYAQAIDRVAALLDENVDKSLHGRAVGYIGPSDLRYVILAVASARVDLRVRFIAENVAC